MIIDAARMSVGDLNPRTVGDLELIEQEAPKRGILASPPKKQKNNANTKGSTRRAGNTQARDLASPPKKAKKRTQTRKAGADEEETTQARDLASPPKKTKKEPQTRKAMQNHSVVMGGR